MYESVLVGSDDSQTARQAVEAAARMAEIAGGKLHILTAYDPKTVRKEYLPRDLQLSTTHPADLLLADLATKARERGLEVVVHAATGDPAEAIVRCGRAGECGPDSGREQRHEGQTPDSGERPEFSCSCRALLSIDYRHRRR